MCGYILLLESVAFEGLDFNFKPVNERRIISGTRLLLRNGTFH